MKLTLHEIAKVVKAKNDWSNLTDVQIENLEFDSRKITENSLFLPLKGARDGHEFISVAFENGAVVTFSEHEISQPHLLVDDCLTAFQKLAAYYLEKMQPQVIAVTGSNGKTTTKDMIASVFATTYKTYKTQGNYNNEIGLPYTVLHMPDNTEKIVLEMGMDRLGDIDLLSNLAKPEIAVVTLIGESHLEFFGSREKIAEGKLGIKAGLRENGELIAPADKIINPYLPENTKITRFGADEDIFITKLIESKNKLSFEVNFMDSELSVPLPGKFNATNAMLAAYVGQKVGVSEENIVKALANVELTKNRTEWKKAANGADILSDVYNANPTAMKLILETFTAVPKNENGRKIVVLADMLELGEKSAELHRQMSENLDLTVIDDIYLYGDLMKNLANEFPSNPQVKYFTAFDELLSNLTTRLQENDQILLKGSNSMKLSDIVESLVK